MHRSDPLFESAIPELPLLGRGKVRDIYGVDEGHLLIVTTDRLSAYDVVLPDPIPGKGRILTGISNFWFRMMSEVVPNHLTGRSVESVVKDATLHRSLAGRSIVVKRLRPLPIEAVVRGYLIGSGWRDYLASGSLCGIPLPAGLRQAERLPQTLFTPATKAEAGLHDENISFDDVRKLLGDRLAAQVRELSIAIYERAVRYAEGRGIIIADTKFEFGQDEEGRLFLIDEVLTPDSSRFWPADRYRIGISPPSFDKQFVRDYLDTLDWNRAPPGPSLPPEVVAGTARKYQEAFDILTGDRRTT